MLTDISSPRRRLPGLLATLLSVGVVRLAFGGDGLSLPDALDLARRNNPDLLAARQDIAVGAARSAKARYWIQFNPQVGGRGAHREFAGGDGRPEFGVSATQEVEIAGQRGQRIDEASENAKKVAALLRDRERLLTAAVTRAFFAALAARQRVALQRTIEALDQRILDATTARVRAGDSPRMEANLAEIRYGQARRDTIAGETRAAAALLELKRLLGLPPERVLEPSGELRGSARAVTLPDLLARALAQRPDLLAAEAELARTRAALSLASRGRIPNPTLEGFYETEAETAGGRDRIVGGGLTLPLPLFNRNQAEIMALAAQEQQARHLLDATRLTVEKEVAEALGAYDAARRALEVLEGRVLEPARANFAFIETAYHEGKIDLLQLIVLNNDLVQAQIGYLESLEDFRDAEARLVAAVAGPLTTEPTR
jgi:cobalt-zinc-cadmium efflux system outer membrane protein